jgi:excisionase family DNA binding protein
VVVVKQLLRVFRGFSRRGAACPVIFYREGGDQMERLLKVSDACEICNLWKTKFYELIKRGDVRVVRLGERGIRIHPEEIQRLMKQGIA